MRIMSELPPDPRAIIRLAEEVFGGTERAEAWLSTRNAALAGKSPASRLDTETGRLEITRILHAIARGMCA